MFISISNFRMKFRKSPSLSKNKTFVVAIVIVVVVVVVVAITWTISCVYTKPVFLRRAKPAKPAVFEIWESIKHKF